MSVNVVINDDDDDFDDHDDSKNLDQYLPKKEYSFSGKSNFSLFSPNVTRVSLCANISSSIKRHYYTDACFHKKGFISHKCYYCCSRLSEGNELYSAFTAPISSYVRDSGKPFVVIFSVSYLDSLARFTDKIEKCLPINISYN